VPIAAQGIADGERLWRKFHNRTERNPDRFAKRKAQTVSPEYCSVFMRGPILRILQTETAVYCFITNLAMHGRVTTGTRVEELQMKF